MIPLDDRDPVASHQLPQRGLEGLRPAATRAVGLAQWTENVGLELRVGRAPGQLIERGLDIVAQSDPVDRRLVHLRGRGSPSRPEGDQLVVEVHGVGVVDLLPVVVLGRDGEPGQHGRLEERFQPLRRAHRGHRLVECVERPGEQAGLLARDDEKAPVADPFVQALRRLRTHRRQRLTDLLPARVGMKRPCPIRRVVIAGDGVRRPARVEPSGLLVPRGVRPGQGVPVESDRLDLDVHVARPIRIQRGESSVSSPPV